MFNFDIQRFSSKTVVNPVNGATQLTETGKEIEAINRDYLRVLSPILQNLANTGGAQVGTSTIPDYSSMYQVGLNQINTANNGVNNVIGQTGSLNNQYSGTLNNLANGNLPSGYQANMNLAVQNALSPFSQTFNNMARSGVINSSIGNKWSTDASTAANNAAINAYNQNMTTASGLANTAYGSQLSGLNNLASLYGTQAASAANPFNYAAGFQTAAGSNAKDLLALATGAYQPVGSTFSDYLKAGTGQQSKSTDNSGIWGALGTGAGLAFCFPAGTMISTPDGDVPIEDVKVGDTVSTLCGAQEVTKTIQSVQPIVRVRTTQGELLCTETEWLLTVEGSVPSGELMQGDVLIHKNGGATVIGVDFDVDTVPVYEIVVPWFYAGGFVVDGFDPEEV